MAGPDILIVGGGPAGAIAGLVAARAGARVCILERAAFPRDKLCGDTVNPGALAVLRRLGVAESIEAHGLRVDGMIVTGENGAQIVGPYPSGLHGRAIVRRDFDAALLTAAIGAGCQVEQVVVRRAILADGAARRGRRVVGVVGASRRGERCFEAPVVIGADGRRSALAFGLGLARHPARPRRWAVGAYFADAEPLLVDRRSPLAARSSLLAARGGHRGESRAASGGDGVIGEMHVRRSCYIGVAPVPDGLTNVCVVREATAGEQGFRDVSGLIGACLKADPLLRDRFADASMIAPPVVLGPLAVDAVGEALDGLFLAGDASGFIDPMTGDGLRFAIRGGELAADAALSVLAHGWDGAHLAYAVARRAAFARKWQFNRALRALVASPGAIGVAAAGARLAPGIVRAVIARAGDCHLAA